MTILHTAHWFVFVGLVIACLHFTLLSESGTGPKLIIVFLGLLPLANAPLDWVSLGLTRGLLHYGAAIGGTWRIAVVSLVDILLAAALMFPLAVITAAAISVANWSSVSGGGAAVLPLAPMFDALRNSPHDPKFYWVYLMLFSTLLPSAFHILGGLVGLALGCLLWVLKSAKWAQDFVQDKTIEDVTKQTKLVYWYPAGAATGVTALAAVVYLVGSAVPYVTAAAIRFGELLLVTAEWTASFFPA